MADALSSRGLIEMTNGTASGSWGTVLNASMIAVVDTILAQTTPVSVASSDVNLSITQSQSVAFTLTGILTTPISVTLPLAANSTTQAVGGTFLFDNQATGAFAVTVKTVASGSTGVEVPQGVKSMLYSNGSAVVFADDAQNRLQTYNGNPNGNVAGSAGSVATRASVIIDRSTNTEYLCTTSGTASAAVWSVNLPFAFPAQGYLTASNDATNPILTADSLGASTIYYTAFRGNLFWVYNGISFVPVPITAGQIALTLTSGAQAANGIYDVIGFLNGTATAIGFSPGWQTVTAGAGARGTGAGTPQLTRTNGLAINTVAQTVNNGATTYSVAAGRGTYLGTVFIDSSAGQVTCHRTYGQSRKFGIWNAFNREPIKLIEGDPTASWDYTSATVRPARNDTANSITVSMGLPEEEYEATYQSTTTGNSNGSAVNQIGIGVNSTGSMSGTTAFGPGISGNAKFTLAKAEYVGVPFIGSNVITALEASPGVQGNTTWLGTQTNMRLTAEWNG